MIRWRMVMETLRLKLDVKQTTQLVHDIIDFRVN